MAKEQITVMVCDRCFKRLELRGSPRSAEYEANLKEAGKWVTLRQGTMGGDVEKLLCPDDLLAYQRFMDGQAVSSV